MRSVPVKDHMILAVPVGRDPSSEQTAREMNEVAMAQIWVQYGDQAPDALREVDVEWRITDEPDQIEAFQPAGDCSHCVAGNDQARAFMAANPGRFMALANITYIEVWEE